MAGPAARRGGKGAPGQIGALCWNRRENPQGLPERVPVLMDFLFQ